MVLSSSVSMGIIQPISRDTGSCRAGGSTSRLSGSSSKPRQLMFPLSGGSSIPAYFRKPEIELAADTPIKNSIVVGDAADEGAIFHCVDVLQAFVDRRKGGETGVKSVQSVRGPETWKWVEHTPWAGNLLEAVRKNFDLTPGHLQDHTQSNVCVVEYNDGTNAAVISGRDVGWT